MTPLTIQGCLQVATQRLGPHSDTPRLDAELLLAMVLEQPRVYLYTWPERGLNGPQQQHFETLLTHREAGMPVAYLTGQREFWSLDLAVSTATLIPRPETELLVELALAHLPDQASTVLDLGTGSGAVALALATERPDLQITATDVDAETLHIAQQNAQQLGLENLRFLQGDWYAPLERGARFQMVVSNPPYLAADDPHLSQGDLRFEPRQALVANAQGLADLQHIIDGAGDYLLPGGWCLLEHGYDQGSAVEKRLGNAGFAQICDYPDGEGRPRVAAGRLAPR